MSFILLYYILLISLFDNSPVHTEALAGGVSLRLIIPKTVQFSKQGEGGTSLVETTCLDLKGKTFRCLILT